MERERWQRVERLYHSALERRPGDRAVFLEQACAHDEALRKEVESLLACQEKATDFIESPALEEVAQLLTKEEIEGSSPRSLLPGTTISHYRIEEKIGAGGMGEVYRAHDPRLGRDVAIKILPEALAADADRLRRFEQEARAAAALNHPNIVAIYDVGTGDSATPYVVSELLEGETLRRCLERGPLPLRRAMEVGAQIAQGLAAAHDKGIIHRDLKPENLWLTKDGHAKILDFGLAKLMPEEQVRTEMATLTETTSTKIMGTLGYMSPEQVRGQGLDQRTDIFSLGAVLYEMLSGRRAFRGATPAETISAILTRDPPELASDSQSFPGVISGIVRRSLEKNPNDRFKSARDLAFVLAAASETGSTEGRAGVVRKAPPRALWMVGLAAVAIGLLWLWNPGDVRNRLNAGPSGGAIRSLAVLPLENVSGKAEQEYFADGMTEELITRLASLNDVRVISRTSVMQFRATREPLSKIGSMLHVDAVVEGSVLRDGNRVRITARLVKVDSDRQLWAHSYEGDVADAIGLQGEIARSVSDEIKAKITPENKEQLNMPQHPVPPEAYDAYLQGLYYAAKLTPDDLQKAFGYFNQATQRDPTLGVAYAGLAESYSWAVGLNVMPTQETLEKVQAAAEKALAIDPNLGTAHHSLAWVKYARDWDFPGAEKEFRRAIELNPNNATTQLWYGMFLAQRGRSDESLAAMREAKSLDPFSPIVNGLAMTPLLTSHQYEKLIEEASAGLKSNPTDGVLHWLLGQAYAQMEDIPKAIDEQEKQAGLYGEDPQKAKEEFAALRRDYAARGARAYWQSREKSMAADAGTDPFDMAVIQSKLGETDAMFASLEKAYQKRSTELLYWVQSEPAFDKFRSDARFRDLMRRIGRGAAQRISRVFSGRTTERVEG
jgi:eukaryotic-like serine/threonine-protein kinase